MIQETEMKQRLARMVGQIKSFQFMAPPFEQDVQASLKNLHRKPGRSSL